MDEPIQSWKAGPYTVQIFYDDNPSNPREDSNVGTMACHHQRHHLGDEDLERMDFFVSCDACDGTGLNCPVCDDSGNVQASPVEYFKKKLGARVVIPLWLYEHSGMTIRAGEGNPFHDPWDSGQVGWIYDTPEGVNECMGKATDEQIEKALLGEVEVYNSFLTGECFEFVILDKDEEIVESCCGFTGDISYCIDEAKAAASALTKKPQPHVEESTLG